MNIISSIVYWGKLMRARREQEEQRVTGGAANITAGRGFLCGTNEAIAASRKRMQNTNKAEQSFRKYRTS
jgi:hypothetical protein